MKIIFEFWRWGIHFSLWNLELEFLQSQYFIFIKEEDFFDVLLLRQVTIVLSDRCWDNWLHSGSVIICKCDMGHYYQHRPIIISAIIRSQTCSQHRVTQLRRYFIHFWPEFSLRSGAAVSWAPLIAARQRLLIVIPCSAQHPWLLILYCSQI